MSITTRSQEYLKLAEKLVGEVEPKDGGMKKIYGGLCHKFPVLVLTCGLCQAVAFSCDKATGESDRAKAHGLLLEHVAKVLGSSREQLTEHIRTAPLEEYMLDTRRVLDAWSYFKRFAVSILKVENAREAEDGE